VKVSRPRRYHIHDTETFDLLGSTEVNSKNSVTSVPNHPCSAEVPFAFYPPSLLASRGAARRLAGMPMQVSHCAAELLRGEWMHDGPIERHLEIGWSWQAGATTRPCRLLPSIAAQERLRNKWVLVVGDSVARFLYAGLLTLANGSDPGLGWPTHRVLSGTCMARVVANGSQQSFGLYHPGCALRWRSICSDGADAHSPIASCTLDYWVARTHTRLTFLWVTFMKRPHLNLLQRRLAALQASANRAPDVLIASVGHWDMLYPTSATCSKSDCCTAVAAGLRAINAASNASIKLLNGYFACPACPSPAQPLSPAGFECANWAGVDSRNARTHVCAQDVASANGFAYLDVQQLTDKMPLGIVSSPCGHGHHFGVLVDAQAQVIASLLPIATLARAHSRATSDAFLLWESDGLGLDSKVVRCRSDTACELPREVAEELAEQEQLLLAARHLEVGQRAGLCAPTSGRSGHGCTSSTSGFWEARSNGIRSMADCVAKCQSCQNCRFVSFSRARAHDDCSWYQRCDLGALMPPPDTGRDYSTVEVSKLDHSLSLPMPKRLPRQLTSLPQPLLPPPPPRQLAAVVLNSSGIAQSWHTGYCARTTTVDVCSGEEEMGSFQVDWRGNNWTRAVAQCTTACLACEQCHYISVSLQFRDCSWYRHCQLAQLHDDIGPFRSMRVRWGSSKRQRHVNPGEDLTPLWAQLRALSPPGGCWVEGCSSKSARPGATVAVSMALAAQTWAVAAEENGAYSHMFRAVHAFFLCAVVSRFAGQPTEPTELTAYIPSTSKKYGQKQETDTAVFVELQQMLNGPGGRITVQRHFALPGCKPKWELGEGQCCLNATERTRLRLAVAAGASGTEFHDLQAWPHQGRNSARQVSDAFRSVVWANLGVFSPPTSEVALLVRTAGASNGRTIVEEGAVAHAIAKVFARRRPRWEFKHSSLQALSYRTELRLFRRTKFLISLFGGALENCVRSSQLATAPPAPPHPPSHSLHTPSSF
jgi:hypothetical protein